MIPVAQDLASALLRDDDMMEHIVKQATKKLFQCYACLSGDDPFAADLMAQHSRKVGTLLVHLELRDGDKFRVKPKLYLFQEVCEIEFSSRLAAMWTYREEELGGTIAAWAGPTPPPP